MSRGNAKPLGAEFTNANGYTYVKTEKGWEPKANVILEQKLGRPLGELERAVYLDGNRANLDPSNIGVKVIQSKSPKTQLAAIEYEIEETKAKLEDLRRKKAALEQEIAESKKR